MFSDLRPAVRSLTKSPGYCAIAIIVLALGIGASTAIFSVVHALLLKPLDYADARQLVQVQSRHAEQGTSVLAPATFRDVATQAKAFTAIAAQTYDYANLTGIPTPARVIGLRGTDGYFKLWGVAPLLGRTWNDAETKTSAAPVVVLSEKVWRTSYAADPGILTRTIKIDDVAHTVIGVMPASFSDPWGNAGLWRPFAMDTAEASGNRSERYWSTFARLAPGVTRDQAGVELAALARALEQSFPEHYRGWTLAADDLHDLVVGDYRRGLFVLLGAVGCVLLITCANVAGLAMVRASARRKEFAIRTALGAGRFRLLRQLMTESILLAMIGGALGVLASSWGIDALLASIPDGWLPRSAAVALDWPVLLTALGLTLGTGLLFGLAPGLSATHTPPQDALRDQSHGSAGPTGVRIRQGLVVVEIALALMLLCTAGLLARSFGALLQRNPGIDATRVLSAGVSLPASRYATPEQRRDFYERAERAVASLPGVEQAAFTQTSPFRWGIPMTFVPVGAAPVDERSAPSAFYDSVGETYFATMGTPLLQGRVFAATDAPGAAPVVILSATAAKRLFGQANPIGRYVAPAGNGTARFEVVGVVGDIRRTGLTSSDLPLQLYRPLRQRPTEFATLMVRSPLPPATLANSVRAAIWKLDAELPVSDVAPMDEIVGHSLTQPRLYLLLIGGFAGLALGLSCLGLYGLIAYGVAQRTREFGIRTALGATPSIILRQVLTEGGWLIGLGLLGGAVGTLASAHGVASLLADLPALDPLVFGTVTLVLGVASVVACWIPARRATRIDPLTALRSE